MLKYLLQKEFLQIRRNAFLPRLIFLFPIVMMCVIPWVMNQEVKNIRVCVVDNDRSVRSQQLVHRIEASSYFIFTGQQPTYAEALHTIETSEADIVLVIPPDYSKGRGQVLIAANAVNGTKGSIGSGYLSQIVGAGPSPVLPQREGAVTSDGSSSLSTQIHSALSLQGCQEERTECSFWTGSGGESFTLYNPHQDYKVFMIPALFAILTMLMCGFLPTLNIVGEKEAGTIEQMNVTPVPKWAFILAKLIPYWLIALFIITACLVLSWAVYGITCQGPLGLVYLLAMLLALFFSSLGLIISNYSDTMQQAIFVMWFFVVCLMLLSGLFTPTRSMPDWAYLTTYVNPMHYFIDAIRTVFVRGGNFASIAHQVLALTLIGLTTATWAVASYRKNN